LKLKKKKGKLFGCFFWVRREGEKGEKLQFPSPLGEGKPDPDQEKKGGKDSPPPSSPSDKPHKLGGKKKKGRSVLYRREGGEGRGKSNCSPGKKGKKRGRLKRAMATGGGPKKERGGVNSASGVLPPRRRGGRGGKSLT